MENQKIKNSEERIIRYLQQVKTFRKYTSQISMVLEMDYSYLIKILHSMEHKGWLTSSEHHSKRFYELTEHAPKIEVQQQFEDNNDC